VKPIRGNIDTRIRKVREGLFDAIILAEVGLHRLGVAKNWYKRLYLKDFTPCAGQGALAIVARKDRRDIMEILGRVNHIPSMTEILCERAFLRKFGGSCETPLGALAHANRNRIFLSVAVYSPDYRIKVRFKEVGDVNAPEKLGIKMAKKIWKSIGDDLRDCGDIHEKW
jgi:hydroxymethylbilane synthase